MSKRKIIGFVGQQTELILYLTNFLLYLNQKVLIQDLNPNRELSYIIQQDSRDTGEYMLSYLEADFTNTSVIQDQLVYDFILVDFGFHQTDEISKCDHVWYCTDLQAQNIFCMNQIEPLKQQESILILKDFLNHKISKKYILKELENLINGREPYILPFDSDDYKIKLSLQYDNICNFKNLNKEYFELFKEQLEEYGFDKNEIKRAKKQIGRKKRKWF